MGRPKGSKNKPKLTPSKETKKATKKVPKKEKVAPVVAEPKPVEPTPVPSKVDTPKEPVVPRPSTPAQVDPERQKAIDAYNAEVRARMDKFMREVKPGDPDVLQKWFEALGPSQVDW